MENDIALHSDILVVDDNLLILKYIQQLLEDKYRIRIAQSAEVAYVLMGRSVPDLILLDLEMPKIDGYEFLEKIRTAPKWKNIPVVFLTGTNDRDKEEKALNMGAVDYILKPISEGVLIKRINLHLELRLYQKKLEDLVAARTKELLKAQDELRKAAEIANESLRVKSVFVANMSHEIRTPINNIIGFAELAMSNVENAVSFDPAKAWDYLQKIKASSEGLLRIINDVLDISKLESGKLILENIPFDISDVFKSCQTLTQLRAAEQGITLFCYAEPSIGKRVMGDPAKLRQALLNLLSNAVKFTNHGIVKMLASIDNVTGNSVTIHFEVKDSGIGMQRDQINRLFMPFEQADTGTARKYGGTGLGLPITKNIIELMGGKLEVESMPGVGSKFSFDLTFETIDEVFPVDVVEPEITIIEKPFFNGNILVCEDNLLNQQIILEHLTRVGFNVSIAADGREAIDCVQRRMNRNESPFDLIFMDIHMPAMDGLEAAEKLVKMGSVTPIIALTANIMPTNRVVYRQAGMIDYIAKPFTAQKLWSCLLKHLIPVSSKAVDENMRIAADKIHREKLLADFLEDNQTTMKEINEALAAGDVKSAYERTHTLRNVAALIGKHGLSKAAHEIELLLAGEENEITPEQLNSLEMELNAVMDELALKSSRPPVENDSRNSTKTLPDKTKVLDLINFLEQKIQTSDLECLDFLDTLSEIPGTEILITQMEQLEFALAGETIAEIKKKLEGDTGG